MSKKNSTKQKWPDNCVWPEPMPEGFGEQWDEEDASLVRLDEEGEELLEIKEYFDQLVEEGRLNEDYSLNEDFIDEDACDNEVEFDPYDFEPKKGSDYWDDGFDLESWQYDLEDYLNLLKIGFGNQEVDPVSFIRDIIEYEFINENLLRQAFTRRAFAIEYGLTGCNEELEFLGDSVLNSIVTREIIRQLMVIDVCQTEAPFKALRNGYDEGVLSKIRSEFISKEYLSKRASELELDRLILYGTGEEATESSREDMMEALIGAVALDSNWDWNVLDAVVDKLLCIQLTYPDRYLKATHYDLFNAWHQKHFGSIPSYEVYGNGQNRFYCSIRFRVPENEKGISVFQRIDIDAEESRSKARERAAFRAYAFVRNHGLWIQLKDAHLIPDMDNSINQLQELYQKKYVEEAPVYEFASWGTPETWNCECTCGGVNGYGKAESKTKAKKKAAYMVLVRLLQSTGICEKEWEDA